MVYIDLKYRTDLTKPVAEQSISAPFTYGESQAHRFWIENIRGNLEGSVTGQFIRPDGNAVVLTEIGGFSGIENGKAWVVLSSECYAFGGYARLIVNITNGAQVTTVLNVRLTVGEAINGVQVDPGNALNLNLNDVSTIVAQATKAEAEANKAAASAAAAAQSAEDAKLNFDELRENIDNLSDRVTAIEDMDGLHRYGVTGIGMANATLTRLYDAVGMTAQVGTDGDNSRVVNNFDDVAPFNRRKCVGEWRLYEGKPVFHVNAYYGDPDYTEDGSMGDYVAVDCPPAYYKYDVAKGELVISAHHYDGYRPFDCLMDRTTDECRPHTYLPCYALAMKDGHAVSLPGLNNEQGDYKGLFDKCKTGDTDVSQFGMLMPTAVNFYEWAMFTVEFATTNCQSIMSGCSSLRSGNTDRIKRRADGKWIYAGYASDAARDAGTVTYYNSVVEGEYISIHPENVDANLVTNLASHKINSIVRCNADGTPNASGVYLLMDLEDLGSGREFSGNTNYRVAGRPYATGACNGVSTPSGSPVNNVNGFYPMKYRWRENVFSNQYQTVADLMNFAVVEDGFANANGNYQAHLEWWYHRDPETLVPKNYSNSADGRNQLIADGWELLSITTPKENYINGWIKNRMHDNKYPDVWAPGEIGASASTYFADNTYLVYSHVLRAVRFGGYCSSGSPDGFSLANAAYYPAYGFAYYGGGLYYPQ